MERGNGQTGETRWNGNSGGDSNISPFIFDSGQTSLEALRELLPERNSAERLIQVYFKVSPAAIGSANYPRRRAF